MPGPSGYAPAPTTVTFRETRLCGRCATLLTKRPDGSWVHCSLAVRGHDPSPWGEPITYGTTPSLTESEARLMDGNR